MRTRPLLIIVIIALILIGSYTMPTDARVIILAWNYRIDMHLYAVLAGLVLLFLSAHWAIALGSWLKSIPSRIRHYRQQKAENRQQKHREQGLYNLLITDFTQAQRYFAYAAHEKTEHNNIDHLAAAYCALNSSPNKAQEASSMLEKTGESADISIAKANLQAQTYAALGKTHLALECLERFPVKNLSASNRLLLGKLYVQTHRWQTIEDYIKQHGRSHPEYVSAWLITRLFQQHAAQSKDQLSIDIYGRLAHTLQNNISVFIAHTQSLYNTGNIDTALQNSIQLLSKHGHVSIAQQIAYLVGSNPKTLQSTVDALEKTRQQPQQAILSMMARGYIELNQHHWLEAQKIFDEALQLANQQSQNPDNSIDMEIDQVLAECIKQHKYCENQLKQAKDITRSDES